MALKQRQLAAFGPGFERARGQQTARFQPASVRAIPTQALQVHAPIFIESRALAFQARALLKGGAAAFRQADAALPIDDPLPGDVRRISGGNGVQRLAHPYRRETRVVVRVYTPGGGIIEAICP